MFLCVISLGPYISSSGIARMRRGDLNEVLRENLDAVDRAIEQHKERTKSQCHVPERKLKQYTTLQMIHIWLDYYIAQFGLG